MSNHDFQYVGQDFEVPDGRAKVTGEAKYADDYLFDNALQAKTVKSPYAHARVRSIDTSATSWWCRSRSPVPPRSRRPLPWGRRVTRGRRVPLSVACCCRVEPVLT